MIPEVAIVMAGGMGTRLRQLTVTIPKPLLPVGSRAILEIILRQIRAAGIRRAYVSIGYRGYLVRSFLQDLQIPGLEIDVVEEEAPLGTAGALRLLPPGEEAVFAINGDVLTRAPMADAIAQHRTSGAALTMLVHRHSVPMPYGIVDVDGKEVSRIREKPTIDVKVATGMYVISRPVIERIAHGERIDMPDVISAAIARGDSVQAFEFDELWTDVADLADFEKVNLSSEEWEDL